jgi:hypothetical protein
MPCYSITSNNNSQKLIVLQKHNQVQKKINNHKLKKFELVIGKIPVVTIPERN